MPYINCTNCGTEFSVGFLASNYEGIVACPDPDCNTQMRVKITPDKTEVEPTNCTCDF